MTNKKEKVIFLVDVGSIAKKGEVKEVGEAFARNFLLPKQKALIYSKVVDKRLQYQKTKLKEQQALKKEEEEKLFASINQKKLTFFLREKNKKIFGSVVASTIVARLKENFNIQISKESLLNFKPLRRKGEFPVEIRISKNFIAKLQVIVDSHQENTKMW